MHIWTVGLNHKSATLDLRERFAFASDQLPDSLSQLRGHLGDGAEVAILSTCNRTELYGAAPADHTQGALDWLGRVGGVSSSSLQPHVYVWQNTEAARHAFRVASGLDSMVLGEPQILGQLKQAIKAAETHGAMGSALGQLFQRSFAIAKKVRSSTEIGAHSVSMAAAGVRLASRLFERFEELSVLLVGAGEMIEHCAAHFQARQPHRMVIANRSEARGQALAQRWQAEQMPLADLPHRLHEFDIVISCTASTLPLIGLGAVKAALRQRKHRPVFMLDLAVPRDIEPQVKGLSDVFLYTVDDLAEVVQSGMDQRRQAYTQAETIIEEGVNHYQAWLSQRRHVPLIQQVHALSHQWHEQELARALKMLEKGDAPAQVLEQFSRGLRQKMMHPYLQALSDTETDQRELAEASLRRVFLSQKA
jgi:glutamyl-tRNA reductase